jgi:hypothetical protein
MAADTAAPVCLVCCTEAYAALAVSAQLLALQCTANISKLSCPAMLQHTNMICASLLPVCCTETEHAQLQQTMH